MPVFYCTLIMVSMTLERPSFVVISILYNLCTVATFVPCHLSEMYPGRASSELEKKKISYSLHFWQFDLRFCLPVAAMCLS